MKRIVLKFLMLTMTSIPSSYAADSVKNASPDGVKAQKSLIKTTIF